MVEALCTAWPWGPALPLLLAAHTTTTPRPGARTARPRRAQEQGLAQAALITSACGFPGSLPEKECETEPESRAHKQCTRNGFLPISFLYQGAA